MEISDALNAYYGDVFLYYGDIARAGYHNLSTALEVRESKQKNACLILVTYGGDANAAYRVARALHHHYSNIEILIPDICKSAGTLLCVGANKLIFGDRGELGPLDIQISKPDELFESMSGLDIIQALSALENQILSAFKHYLFDIRGVGKLKTKLAADIAAKLADGFISPIAEKIDPVTLGEHQRAMQIAYDYGDRLSKMAESLKPGALVQLVSGYPSHGFVIDRKEAASLFRNVEAPDKATAGLYEWARKVLEETPYPDSPLVLDLSTIINQTSNPEDTEPQDDEDKISNDSRGIKQGEAVTGRAESESKSNKSNDTKGSKSNAVEKDVEQPSVQSDN